MNKNLDWKNVKKLLENKKMMMKELLIYLTRIRRFKI